MKLNITKESFLEGLQIIQSGLSGRTTLPILYNFLMEAENGNVKLTRTDMEMATIHNLKAEVLENGEITVPLKEFSDILKNLPSDKEIKIETDSDNKLHIKSGKSKFWVIGTPKSEYPIVPEIEKTETFKIKAKTIKEMIENTIFSSSTQETRYVLNGLLWANNQEKFEIVATDGRRLALASSSALDGAKDFKIIVPSKILNEVLKLLNINKPTDEDFINVTVSSNQISFSLKDTTFISRLIEGNFPNYEQVVPNKKNISFKVNTKDLLSSTKRAALCAGDLGGTVKYSLADNNLGISANSSKMDFSDEIKIDYAADAFNTSFNPQYLIDVLKIIGSDNVSFSFTNTSQPVLVEPEGKEQYKYVIMPVRA
ncbi:MAG: DNA polymerase III subunit beta [Elusimicrobiota bacterium]|jgi:DNA polymerase-3 subunit beta|nr:DNA polymerase III subunit beta [Elusimicrobiota bacterium]